MNKYRIIIETLASGSNNYYIQKRFLYYFWYYIRENHNDYSYQIRFDTVDEANKYINYQIKYKENKKLVKRSVYIPTNKTFK